MAFAVRPDTWWPSVDRKVMDEVASSIEFMTVALYQGRLGQWPAVCAVQRQESTGGTLAWSMTQLVGVIESIFPDLELKVSQQEAAVARAPRSLPESPWAR
jgi:hypothetical protein